MGGDVFDEDEDGAIVVRGDFGTDDEIGADLVGEPFELVDGAVEWGVDVVPGHKVCLQS